MVAVSEAASAVCEETADVRLAMQRALDETEPRATLKTKQFHDAFARLIEFVRTNGQLVADAGVGVGAEATGALLSGGA